MVMVDPGDVAQAGTTDLDRQVNVERVAWQLDRQDAPQRHAR